MYQGWNIAQQRWLKLTSDNPDANPRMFDAVADRDVEQYRVKPDMRYTTPLYKWWYHTYNAALHKVVKEMGSNPPTELQQELIFNCMARQEHVSFSLLHDLPVTHPVVQIYLTRHSAETICMDMCELGRFDVIGYLQQRGMPVSFDEYHNEGQDMKRLPEGYIALSQRYIPDNSYGLTHTLLTGAVRANEGGINENVIPHPMVLAAAIRQGIVKSFTMECPIISHHFAHNIYATPKEDKQLILQHLTADSNASYRHALSYPTAGKSFYQWYQSIYTTPSMYHEAVLPLASGHVMFLESGDTAVLSVEDKPVMLKKMPEHRQDIFNAMAAMHHLPKYHNALHHLLKSVPEAEQDIILNKLYH